MEKILWNDSFSVGSTQLDQQHRRITDIINQLLDQPTDGLNSRSVEAILNELSEFVHVHFETEERILADIHYVDLATQRKEHKGFRQELAHLCLEAMADYRSIPRGVLFYLRGWWLDHILVKDMQYRPFLVGGRR